MHKYTSKTTRQTRKQQLTAKRRKQYKEGIVESQWREKREESGISARKEKREKSVRQRRKLKQGISCPKEIFERLSREHGKEICSIAKLIQFNYNIHKRLESHKASIFMHNEKIKRLSDEKKLM